MRGGAAEASFPFLYDLGWGPREHFSVARLRAAGLRHGVAGLQDGRCFYCHARLGRHAQADHFIPRVRCGIDAVENLVLADADCNGDKSDLLPGTELVARWASRNAAHGDLPVRLGDLDWADPIERWVSVGRFEEQPAGEAAALAPLAVGDPREIFPGHAEVVGQRAEHLKHVGELGGKLVGRCVLSFPGLLDELVHQGAAVTSGIKDPRDRMATVRLDELGDAVPDQLAAGDRRVVSRLLGPQVIGHEGIIARRAADLRAADLRAADRPVPGPAVARSTGG